jgi:RNA methyltransferase, TrmH family
VLKPPRLKARRPEEVWIYGLSASRALFSKRPEDIRVILFGRERRRELAALLDYAAEQHIPYREVPPEELVAVSGSIHHEGLCLRALLPPRRRLEEALDAGVEVLLAVDRVGNPHNLGAIFRSAAYFGASGVILPEEDDQARLSPAALRVSEGGGELVPSLAVQSLGRAQVELKRRNITVIGTDAQAKRSLFESPLPRPCAVILGNETAGLSEATRSRCDLFISIPGTGVLDSLNVSVAAGVILAELFRTRATRDD